MSDPCRAREAAQQRAAREDAEPDEERRALTAEEVCKPSTKEESATGT